MTVRRTIALVVAALLCSAAPAVAADPPPPCLTLAAADGHEPICNPWLWQSSWDQGHRNPYSQHTTPVPGPRPGDAITARYFGAETTVPAGIPYGVTLGAFFSGLYPDGKRVAWTLSVVGTNDNPIAKHDIDTGEVIDVFTHTVDEGTPPSERAALSGIYILSDRHNHLIQPRGTIIEVYGDEEPGNRLSRIVSLKKFRLPARALCGSGDRLVGQTMRWDGRIGFVTARGQVGVVPSEIEEMTDANLLVHSINGPEKCARADDSLDGLETVSNSLSGDEGGGMYPVTNRAQYRFDVRDGKIAETWRTEYQTGTTSTVRQDDGSGSTPSLMGTDPDDDRFVLITDGAPLTNLVLMWRDEIPADWRGLPGRPRRIACEVPLNFGDPMLTAAQNEQSVTVRGYSAFVPQNELRNAGAAEQIYGPAAQSTGLPLQLGVAGLAGGEPLFQPYGLERIDWDPGARACAVRWINKEVSIPNGVPTMSSGSGLVYGVGVRDRVWGLEGVDAATGRGVLWSPASPSVAANSFFSALSIAPDGSVWSGAAQGYTVWRGPKLPEPARECKEFERPRSTVTRVRTAGRRLRVTGTAADTGCGVLRRVDVSVSQRLRDGRCRFVTSTVQARLGPPRSCRRPVRLRARGAATWSLRLGRLLPKGRYVVRPQAVDGVGNRERTTRRAATTVR